MVSTIFETPAPKFSISRWPFITLKRSDGEKVYVRTHSVDFEANQLAEINVMTSSLGVNGLLGDSKAAVWDEANELVLKKMTALPPVVLTEEVVAVGGEEQELWVEKYKPKKYMDLLSDETTNRSLLQWLKMWDNVVFGR
jgi:chromosome transmission fidelity protein 18